MDDKEKKFIVPEAEVVNFDEEDIITMSDGGADPGFLDEDWGA